MREAVDIALRKRAGTGLPPVGAYALEVRHADDRGYTVSTDLPRVSGLPDDLIAQALNEGLLGVGGINCAIDDMRVHSALVGLKPGEVPILGEKLQFLRVQLDPRAQADRLTRVLAAVHLPDLAVDYRAERANVERLLAVRESEECRAFREWLWSADDVTDQEIRDRFSDLRIRLGSLVRGGVGRTVRWAVGLGAGTIPALGIGVSLLDTFAVERLLPMRGALTFLGDQYRSVFD